MAALRIMNSLSHMRSELLNPVKKTHINVKEGSKNSNIGLITWVN